MTARRLLHALAHAFGWNRGLPVTAVDRHKLTWVAFKCAGCGRVRHRGLASWHRPPTDEEFI